jgi:hypothetical protein
MYYPDLTEYSYAKQIGDEDRPTLNVGWLDSNHQFPEGQVEPEVIDQLRRLCVTSQVNVMRGIHACPFCSKSTRSHDWRYTGWNGKQALLGHAELRVVRRIPNSVAANERAQTAHSRPEVHSYLRFPIRGRYWRQAAATFKTVCVSAPSADAVLLCCSATPR